MQELKGISYRNHPLYYLFIAFHHAKDRCQNPNRFRYADYGGRGIEFRLQSVEELYIAISERPTHNHSIDRIHNNGHYECGNIRWATKKEQVLNQRSKRTYSNNKAGYKGIHYDSKRISCWRVRLFPKNDSLRHYGSFDSIAEALPVRNSVYESLYGAEALATLLSQEQEKCQTHTQPHNKNRLIPMG